MTSCRFHALAVRRSAALPPGQQRVSEPNARPETFGQVTGGGLEAHAEREHENNFP
jgi:hypothetical protein